MSLAWAMVRHRFAGFAGTFLALALGVAIIAGCTTLWASSRPELPQMYAASDVLVRSPEVGPDESAYPEFRAWSPEETDRLAGELARIPGVTAAVPHRTFYVQRVLDGRPVGDPREALHGGHAWSAAALGGYTVQSGRKPDADGEVAVGRALGVPVGAPLSVLTAEGPASWTVTATLDGSGFYVADVTARRLAAGVKVIGLTLAPGADVDTVAAAAGRVTGDLGQVLHGAARDALEPESVTRIRWLGAQLIIAMVALGGFVAVFVVASTCALSAAQRRREIALLRAVGATPGQVRRMMYAEVLVVALGAGAVGAALGAVGAPLLADPFVRAGLQPPDFEVRLVPWALGVAFVVGVVVALLGVWSSARRSSRVPALDALRTAAVERRPMTVARWVFGLGALVAGLAMVAALPAVPVEPRSAVAMGSAMALIVAGALLAPVVTVPLVRLVTWPFRHGAIGLLVREGTLVAVRRIASTAAPVLVTVGFAVLLTGSIATISDAVGIQEAAKVPVATVAAPDNAPGLSDAAVATLPGRSDLPTRVLVGTAAYGAIGTADVDGLVLDADAATELRVTAGGLLAVRFADGRVLDLPVTAVRPDLPASLVLPRALVREHDPAALTPYVRLSGAATPAVGVRVLSARDYVQLEIDEEDELVRLFLAVLLGLSVGYTGLAVANTLLMATAARRVDFATLRLAGATSGQTVRMVVAEAVLAVAVGTGLGLAVAVTALVGVRNAVADEIGAAVTLVMPWSTVAVVAGTCVVLAALSAALPARRAAR